MSRLRTASLKLDRSDCARRLLRRRVREAEDRVELAALGAVDGLWEWNLTADEVIYSRRWKSMLGYDVDEIGRAPSEWTDRVHEDDRHVLDEALDLHLKGETPHFECEYRMRQHDGTYRWMYARGVALRDRDGSPIRIAGSQTDIQERRMAVEELMKTAFHDGLTGLPNRFLFMDRLSQLLAKAQRDPLAAFAVMFLDLDRFKVINDTLGHLAGDQLLVEVSHRLQYCVRPGDTVARGGRLLGDGNTVARLGGDEFTIILEGVATEREAVLIAERIEKELSAPFDIGGRETYTSASIGIALSWTGYVSADDMIRDADTAMYRAKNLGRSRFEICDHAMHESIRRTIRLESDLREAIEQDEFVLNYQAIVDLRVGRISGFEALLRWEHPEQGLVSPERFIEIAEESGSIREIGSWVFRRVCLDLTRWNGGEGSHWISVNVSARELVLAGFVESLIRQVTHSGVDPARLKIEVTESAIISNVEIAVKALHMVRDFGIGICIDDFGTGYSSFSNLSTYPVDTLKIDQSFVSGMSDSNENWKLVGTMVPLAAILGKTSVAEGVETTEQVARLRELGCTFGQGFYFARPMAFAAAVELLASDPRW
jgi:diguanylate cyclase (GGDEF)-like protein/PAS domain S-box-containing protein